MEKIGSIEDIFAADYDRYSEAGISERLCEDLCRRLNGADKPERFDIRPVYPSRTIVFIPQVNPDGVDIAVHGSKAGGGHAALLRAHGADIRGFWQANANGVDLNHNFNAGRRELLALERSHGISGPCARRYGGSRAESEPEVAALCRLCRRMTFSHVVALHSQGEEIYWQYGDRTPPHAHMTARLFGNLSGYTPAEPSPIASHGGFKDWFIEEFGRMGFTFELGRGTNPLPLNQFEDVYRKARDMLLCAAVL
ncbi:MAG: gamma-D-glutamyl-meso-diaminopimelate peptidase [Clostridia bacterium]|nr:gamma-D-glutamyl-meso-diaminopimelate peptidase [Clostridia bacterium]